MNIRPTNTVAELALENPASTRVLEQYGIDYCCGGGRKLEDACRDAGLDFNTLISSIEEGRGRESGVDWGKAQLSALTMHIVETHHVFTRSELSRLTALVAKVCDRHGANHPELLELRAKFEALKSDLIPHMLKEEQVLFPYIHQLEQAIDNGTEPPFPFFGTVRNPVRMMMQEHDVAGDILREIRALTSDFTPPQDACISYTTLYGALRDFEADLHQHIHLENNILFPRAVETENSVSTVSREDQGAGHTHGCFGA